MPGRDRSDDKLKAKRYNRVMAHGTVSVIIPSYNYALFLEEAVKSVLDQSRAPLEIVVADDGSTDGSANVLRGLETRHPGRLRVLRHEGASHRGIVATYQLAARGARGDYLAFLEADDRWRPQNLAQKAGILDRWPGVGTVYSDYRPFGHRRGCAYWNLYRLANRFGTPRRRGFSPWRDFLRRNPVATFSNFMTRRALFLAVPRPPEEETYYDWWTLAHLAAASCFYYIPEPLVFWRIHERSANFGPLDTARLRHLIGFWGRVSQSLLSGDRALLRRRDDGARLGRAHARAGEYQDLLNHPNAPKIARTFLREPLPSMRFLLHAALTQWLLATEK